MSPGATFERVYLELKRRLVEGELPPGAPIEPAIIGSEIASSITPVRDALHRLTGERLVEAPNHNGFRVPLPTEAGLRDLYNWNAQIVGLAARHIRPSLPDEITSASASNEDVVASTGRLFVEMARATSNAEHVRAVQQLNDRLAPFRRVEVQVLDGIDEEHDELALHFHKADRTRLVRLLDRYRRTRLRVVPELLALSQAEALSTR